MVPQNYTTGLTRPAVRNLSALTSPIAGDPSTIRINVANLHAILAAPPSQLRILLPRVFATLTEDDQDETLLLNYTGALKSRFDTTHPPGFPLGFDAFTKECMNAGIIKCMLQVTRNLDAELSAGDSCVIAGYHATDMLHHMVRSGTIAERKRFTKEFVEEGGVDLCLDKLVNHPKCIHRHNATVLMRAISSEAFLPDFISAEKTSEIMIKMSQFINAGPGFFIEQMENRATQWQSRMFMGGAVSTAKSIKYVPRYYAMAQESAIWTCHALLVHTTPRPRRFVLEVIRHDPSIFDELFRNALVRRQSWYPEGQTDSVAAEVLAILFHFPLSFIAGVNEKDDEWDAMAEIVTIFTSRDKWVEMIVAVWKHIEEENMKALKTMFSRVRKDHYAQEPPSEEDYRTVFEYRGCCRISMLRIISTLTYFPNPNLTDAALLSLLRIGYLGSQKIKTNMSDVDMHSEADVNLWIERAMGVCRTPMHAVFTGAKYDASAIIPEEVVSGPLALIRIMTVLAERNQLSTPARKSLPPATSPSTSLNQVQQITAPNVLKAIVNLALKRVVLWREKGHERMRRGSDWEFAGATYQNAAELALALVAFDDATNGQFSATLKAARSEVVLCLGNAAEMALRRGLWARALPWAERAVADGEKIGPPDISAAVVAKNKRRVDMAKSGLAMGTMSV
ncbi:hypothetical protein PLICRDRAFT_172683 [Plicaturopsis crispa FD-325 SS-3]|nr:hypothetical protein PLICRDRAFT_172683 [Plicaturopsis crispa FD-325 SS-3]